MKELAAYWTDRYDWRAHEARLNGFRQFTAPVAGIDLHFIHEEGRGPNPLPLLLSHGWPGSVWEFHKILPMLTDPARFGGDPADAFTVIAPSLPGYGFSFAPGQPRFGVAEIADVFASLMTDTLGYRRFAAQGGDWGGFITSKLGAAYPDRLAGHPREPAVAAPRHQAAGPALAGGEAVPRGSRPVAARGDGLPVDPGHPAPDAGLRPQRFAGGPRGLDRGEVPDLERLRRRRRAPLHQGRAAHQRDDLLGDRQHQRLLLALLRALPLAVAHRGRPAHRGPDRLRRVPEGDRAAAARPGPSACTTSGAGR